MGKKEMAARPETNATTSKVKQADVNRKTKIETILGLFVSGLSLNRFEAERHHDHCLHTTVSTLENGHGILIERESETVPCVGGSKTTRCKRYWLKRDPDNIKRANALLAYWRRA
jgi:hypothetical protein